MTCGDNHIFYYFICLSFIAALGLCFFPFDAVLRGTGASSVGSLWSRPSHCSPALGLCRLCCAAHRSLARSSGCSVQTCPWCCSLLGRLHELWVLLTVTGLSLLAGDRNVEWQQVSWRDLGAWVHPACSWASCPVMFWCRSDPLASQTPFIMF